MFSALSQNGVIYVLDKTDSLKLKIGEVVGVSTPRTNYSTNYQGSTVDLKVKIDGAIHEFNQIPSAYSLVTYGNGKIVLSETKQALCGEVETLLTNSKQIVDNIDIYKQNIVDCENILKELNPQFAKDKENETRLHNLEQKFVGVENKIDKLITLIEHTK